MVALLLSFLEDSARANPGHARRPLSRPFQRTRLHECCVTESIAGARRLRRLIRFDPDHSCDLAKSAGGTESTRGTSQYAARRGLGWARRVAGGTVPAHGEFAAIWPRKAYRFHAWCGADLGHSPYSGYCRHQFDDANWIGATGGGPTGFLGALSGLRDFESKLARCVGFDDPENAYLAGLLHDLGCVVNLVLFPVKTKSAPEKEMQTGAFPGESEYEALGFTHCQSGEVLARKWNFSEGIPGNS